MHKNYDVCIVGAGVAGASMAAVLLDDSLNMPMNLSPSLPG